MLFSMLRKITFLASTQVATEFIGFLQIWVNNNRRKRKIKTKKGTLEITGTSDKEGRQLINWITWNELN